MSDKVTLTEEEARAYALALARGTGTLDVKDIELRRVMEAGCEFKAHAGVHQAVLSGDVDLMFKQRGAGALEVSVRKR